MRAASGRLVGSLAGAVSDVWPARGLTLLRRGRRRHRTLERFGDSWGVWGGARRSVLDLILFCRIAALGAPTCSESAQSGLLIPARPHFRRVMVIARTHTCRASVTINGPTAVGMASVAVIVVAKRVIVASTIARPGARAVWNYAHPAGTAPVVRGSNAPATDTIARTVPPHQSLAQ